MTAVHRGRTPFSVRYQACFSRITISYYALLDSLREHGRGNLREREGDKERK